jgi:hypothetical protein
MSTPAQKRLSAVLVADAVSCLAMGAAFAVGAGPIGRLTGLPPGFLTAVAAALLPVAVLIAISARGGAAQRVLAPLVVGGNLLWIVASLAVLVLGIVRPNAIGVALVLGQAAAVAVLTALEAAFLWNRQPASAA